mgnify:CR=1 FL=1
MNEVRFQEILAAYGAEPRLWPEQERAAAMAYAAQAAPGLAHREARALDAVLAPYAAPEAGNDLELIARLSRTVAAAAPRPAGSGHPARGRTVWVKGRNAIAAAGFMAAALTGIYIGFSNGAASVSTADASEELVVSFALAEG